MTDAGFEAAKRAAKAAIIIAPAPTPSMNTPIVESNQVLASIARVFPMSVIGPEAYATHFGGKADNGNYRPPPAGLTFQLMNSICPLTNDGSTKVGDTHLLVYVPKTIGDQPFTLGTMAEKFATLFYAANDYGSPAIKATPIREGGWMLIPKIELPGSRNLNLEQQEGVLASFKQQPNCGSYEVVAALPLVTALVMEFLVHSKKSFESFWARTATDIPGLSSHVDVCGFSARDVRVNGGRDVHTFRGRGLAVFRSLET